MGLAQRTARQPGHYGKRSRGQASDEGIRSSRDLDRGSLFLLRMRRVHNGQEPGVLMEKEDGASADDKVTNFKENRKKPDVCDLA